MRARDIAEGYPVVNLDADALDAAPMARLRCPLVAVVERQRLTGVVTTTHLLELILPRP